MYNKLTLKKIPNDLNPKSKLWNVVLYAV